MLGAVNWLALGVGKHNGVVDYAIPALDDFARKCSSRCSDLDSHLVSVIHAIDIRGYSIGLRNLSCAAFVLACRNIITASQPCDDERIWRQAALPEIEI